MGRRKTKPIIYSMSLAVIFTDVVTYVPLFFNDTATTDIYTLHIAGGVNILILMLIK